jgi:prophage regulatory protein
MRTAKKTETKTLLITFPELRTLKGIRYSRISLWRLMAKGEFPQSVRVSSSRIAWRESEVDAWLAALKRGKADAPKKAVRPMASATLQRQTFRTSRLLDFVIIKELIDNALAACEEAGIAPVIIVTTDEDGIEVSDNAAGMIADTIKGAPDYTVRVSSREAYVSPTLGDIAI